MIDVADRQAVRSLLIDSPWWRAPEQWSRVVVVISDGRNRVERRAWLSAEVRRRDRHLGHLLTTMRVPPGSILVLVVAGGRSRVELVDVAGADLARGGR